MNMYATYTGYAQCRHALPDPFVVTIVATYLTAIFVIVMVWELDVMDILVYYPVFE